MPWYSTLVGSYGSREAYFFSPSHSVMFAKGNPVWKGGDTITVCVSVYVCMSGCAKKMHGRFAAECSLILQVSSKLRMWMCQTITKIEKASPQKRPNRDPLVFRFGVRIGSGPYINPLAIYQALDALSSMTTRPTQMTPLCTICQSIVHVCTEEWLAHELITIHNHP